MGDLHGDRHRRILKRFRQGGMSLALLGMLVDAGSALGADASAPVAPVAPSSVTPAADPAKALRTMDEFTGRNALGLTAGVGSGVGISYRRYFTDRIAARGVGYLFYLKDTLSLYHFGLSGQIDIRRDERFVIYGLAGVSFAQAKDPGETSEILTLNMGVFPNAGVGLEWGSHSHSGFVLQGELALTGLIANGSFVRLLPLPQVGVQYLF